jgi:hypothetical protein
MRWVYNIEVPEQAIVYYSGVSETDGKWSQPHIRHLILPNRDTNKSQLIISIPSVGAGSPVLNIERDDLGIFADYKKAFYVVHTDPLNVYLVVYYGGPNVTNEHGEPLKIPELSRNVIAARSILFDKVRLPLFFNMDDINDHLTFIGEEDQGRCIKFRRTVGAENSSLNYGTSYIYSGFTEDTWFCRGIGLWKLEQRVKEQLTMRWILVE